MQRRHLVTGIMAWPFAVIAGATFHTEQEVLVIGGGLAGFSAATAALEAGAKHVLVIEKGPMTGGHALYAAGSFNAVDPHRQSAKGIKDSVEQMTEDLWNWGGRRAEKLLVRTLAAGSTSALEWLESLGIRWLDRVFVPFGGGGLRAHTSNLIRGGYEYFAAVQRHAHRLGVQVMRNTTVESLLSKTIAGETRITGAVLQTDFGTRFNVNARAVVLATGGFTANQAMVRQYSRLPVTSTVTTANPWRTHFDGATGDGIRLGVDVGAALVDMDCIEFLPIRGGRLLDYSGADIFVNRRGERFVNEMGRRSDLHRALSQQPERRMWVITDQTSEKGDTLENKLLTGAVQMADSIEDMSRMMNMPAEKLKATLDRYNAFARAGYDSDFGKSIFTQEIKMPPFYFGEDWLDVHYTSGGIKINEQAEVIRSDGSSIKGLFAAGETTGGIHGEDRMSGCGLLDAVVFGRIAGFSAFSLR